MNFPAKLLLLLQCSELIRTHWRNKNKNEQLKSGFSVITLTYDTPFMFGGRVWFLPSKKMFASQEFNITHSKLFPLPPFFIKEGQRVH